jgi:protein TonB
MGHAFPAPLFLDSTSLGQRAKRLLWESTDDRVVVWVFIAAIVHAIIILGVTFVKPDPLVRQASTLDVILVPNRSDNEPDDAQFVAQANQDGGGTHDESVRPATPVPTPMIGPTAEIVSATLAPSMPSQARAKAREKPDSEDSAAAIVASDSGPSKDLVKRRPPKPRPRPSHLRQARSNPTQAAPAIEPKPSMDAATLVNDSLAYASLSAELDQRLEKYASRPRHKWITTRTRESKYAAYMDAWRSKVERIGNLNYPSAARRERLAGSLLLEVSLNANGSVNEIVLRRSSGHRVLDDAAIRIVKLAAPFAALPASIRRETDILHIERTWQFLPSNRMRSR